MVVVVVCVVWLSGRRERRGDEGVRRRGRNDSRGRTARKENSSCAHLHLAEVHELRGDAQRGHQVRARPYKDDSMDAERMAKAYHKGKGTGKGKGTQMLDSAVKFESCSSQLRKMGPERKDCWKAGGGVHNKSRDRGRSKSKDKHDKNKKEPQQQNLQQQPAQQTAAGPSGLCSLGSSCNVPHRRQEEQWEVIEMNRPGCMVRHVQRRESSMDPGAHTDGHTDRS